MASTLIPLFALFTRALRDDVRSRFPIILRAVLLLILLGLLLILRLFFGSIQATGQVLLGYLAALNFAGITLLGLATFCSAITEEKEDETLGLLRMTRLNPLSIVLGKSTARLTGGLLFVAVQVPFALLCATMGGVSPGQIVTVYAILGAWLFFLCNLGLLASVLCRTTARAVTLTLIISLTIFLLAPVIWFANYGLGGGDGPLDLGLGYLTSINPVLHLANAVAGQALMPMQPDSIAFLLIAGAVCFAAAWRGFERFCGRELQPAAPARTIPARRRMWVPRTWRRALVWKDFYFSTGGRRRIWLRVAVYPALIALSLALQYRSFAMSPLLVLSTAIAWPVSLGFTVEFGLAAAAIFGRERREKTLGTLWALPISTGRLIRQKAGGYALGLLPGALLWVASFTLSAVAMEEMQGSFSGYSLSTFSIRRASEIYAVLQFVFFGCLIAYLSLIMRRGALVAGLLAYLIWNFVLFYIVSAILVSGWYRDDFLSRQAAMYWGMDLLFTVLTIILAFRIPRRLALCAAEE
jgi:hypothetical protein